MTSGNRPKQTHGTIEDTQAIALRLALAAALLTLALAVYARSLDLLRTDIPLRASNGRVFWIVSIVAVVAYGVAVQHVANRTTGLGQPDRRPDTLGAVAGVLPALVVLAALQLVAWDSRVAVVICAPLLAGAGVFTAIVVRHYLWSGDPAVFVGARIVHSTLTAGVAFLSLSLVRGWMAGPGYTLAAIAVIAGLLLYQSFDGIRAFPVRRIAYAVTGAVVLGQVSFALSYGPPTGWFGGAILATIFIVLMLTIEAILARRIATDVVVRYTGAGVAICGLLAFLAR